MGITTGEPKTPRPGWAGRCGGALAGLLIGALFGVILLASVGMSGFVGSCVGGVALGFLCPKVVHDALFALHNPMA